VSLLGERLLSIHAALVNAELGHAFGGAIALAYCTGEPRGTRDLDVNIFIPAASFKRALDALPDEVRWDAETARVLSEDGQVRLWWGETPVDVFLNVHPFHNELAARVLLVPFEGQRIPVLDCTDLAVFKALYDRTKDWADIEEMVAANTLDASRATAELQRLVGIDHPALDRIERVSQRSG